MHLRTRLVVVGLVCTLAFGVGVQWAAATSAPSCSRTCTEECGRGNCETYQRVGCNCYWFCEDGDSGIEYCGAP